MPRYTDVEDDRPLPDAPRPIEHPPCELVSVIWDEGEPHLCAVFPADATPGAGLTEWLTARDDAFVDLEDAR